MKSKKVFLIGGNQAWQEWMVQTETWNISKQNFETELTWPRLHVSQLDPLVFPFADYVNQ